MATQFRENFLETLPFSDTGVKMWLAANVGQSYTVPGTSEQKYRAEFSYSSNSEIWVSLNAANVVPVAGASVATYNEEMLPRARYVVGGDVIHVISTGTPQIGISLLSLPG